MAFGVGWYGVRDRGNPARYRSVNPAWNDFNMRETPLFLAHIRAAIGSPVQQTNCHPFRRGRWLFVHNGLIAGFHELRRELLLAVDHLSSTTSPDRPTRSCSFTWR
jgi:predicted glutamine amidotransferase